MIHPSYSELMQVVNSDTELDEEPLVNSRYSIVLATSKRARQIIGGEEPLLNKYVRGRKPLSAAVEELYTGQVKIIPEEEAAALEAERKAAVEAMSTQAAPENGESERFLTGIAEEEIVMSLSEEEDAEDEFSVGELETDTEEM